MPATSPEDGPRLNLQAAAHLLQVSERTLSRWIATLGIPHQLEGVQQLFSRAALLEWADQHSLRLSDDVSTDTDEAGPLPKLSESIERGGVHRDLPGLGVEMVLENAAQAMRLPDAIDRAFFHQVLLAREDLDSTGIGEGFAVPHVRAPLVLHVEEAYVGLIFLENPIDWHAVDGKPVDTLFVLVCPGLRSHLHLLRRIAQCLQDAELRDLLLARADDAALYERFRALD